MSKPSPVESIPENCYHCPICFYYRIDYSLDVIDKNYMAQKKEIMKHNRRDVTVTCKAADFCSEFGGNFPSPNV